MTSSFSDSFGMRLRRAYLALHRRANAELRRQFEVTADQFVVLSLLAEQDGVTQQELGSRCYSDPSTTGALVRLMEDRGWVWREQDPSDGRARKVHLTRAGRQLQGELWAAALSFHQDLWSATGSDDEERTVFDALDRVVAAMGKGPQGFGK